MPRSRPAIPLPLGDFTAHSVPVQLVENHVFGSGNQDQRIPEIEALTGTRLETIERVRDAEIELEALLRPLARPPEMETILISGGRKDKLRKGDILGALRELARY